MKYLILPNTIGRIPILLFAAITTVILMKTRVAIVFQSMVETRPKSGFVAPFVNFGFTRIVFIYKKVNMCRMYEMWYI